MKNLVKKLVGTISRWPFIGYIVHIFVGVYRLPRFIHLLTETNNRQQTFELEQLPALLQSLSDTNNRQQIFELEQLPALLQSLSEINNRQLLLEKDINNFVRSVPVTLRTLTRDLVNLKEQSDRDQENLKQHLSGQISNASTSVEYLLGRVEFVRRELMFEMRYGGSEPSSNKDSLRAVTEIVSPEKVSEAKNSTGLRLNLGSGHLPLEGYLNVDRRKLDGVDIVAEVDDLPFKSNEVDAFFSAHLLEHFPQEQLCRELLPHLFSLLKEGGEFRAVVPDAEAMIREYTNGRYPYGDLREVIYGAQDYDGDFHFNMFTPDSLTNLLQLAGFKSVTIVEASRKNGKCFEFEITAFKS